MSVAEFYAGLMAALRELGIDVMITTMPCEIADCIPFEQDTLHTAYDADYANRFWRVLLAASEVMAHFRTAFLGKSSPVHFFWGSFDLAVTRFSGRPAPRHPGGVPHLPNAVAQEAYSHEVSSAGFWPGGGGPIDYPAFYSYAYPAPEGFAAVSVKPDAALFSKELGEFLLPYDAMRTARDPDAALMDFLQSTYAAAADLAKWDRKALECGLGEKGKVRVSIVAFSTMVGGLGLGQKRRYDRYQTAFTGVFHERACAGRPAVSNTRRCFRSARTRRPTASSISAASRSRR